MISAGISIHFEADDLFVLAHIEDLASLEEAERVLDAGPSLAFDDGWISLLCAGRPARRLCPTLCDDCGRWPPGADRDSSDDYRAGLLSIPQFMTILTPQHVFRPTWFGIVEYEKDEEGRFKDLIRTVSGGIDKLGCG